MEVCQDVGTGLAIPGGKSPDVITLPGQVQQGSWLTGYRLCWGRKISGHRALWYRGLNDRKQRFAGYPVQQEYVALFGGLGQTVHRFSALAKGKQRGLGGNIEVPNVVMHSLELPQNTTTGTVQGNH